MLSENVHIYILDSSAGSVVQEPADDCEPEESIPAAAEYCANRASQDHRRIQKAYNGEKPHAGSG